MANFFSKNKTINLSEDQLDDPLESCDICASPQLSRVLQINDQPPVWMVRCAKCGIVTAERVPSSTFLDHYYSDYYADPVPEGGQQVTVGAVQKLARHIFRHLDAAAPGSTLRILDYGGGDGSVAVELAQLLLAGAVHHVEICVIDISDTVLATSDPRVTLGIRHAIEDQDTGRYDVVIASASLEHIRHPGTVIRQLLGCLNGSGVFYARTPFHIAMATLAQRIGLRFNMGYPAHLHDMGAPFWDKVLDTLQLTDRYKRIRSTPSVVSSTFASNFPRTLAAYVLKAPWYVLGNRYAFVGGWEIVITPRRQHS